MSINDDSGSSDTESGEGSWLLGGQDRDSHLPRAPNSGGYGDSRRSKRSPGPVPIPGKHGGRGQGGSPYSVSVPVVRPLVDPLLNESDVASSYGSESSTSLRRKEAAEGGVGEYASLGEGMDRVAGLHRPKRLRRPHHEMGGGKGIDNDWHHVPESSDHKREEHATTDMQTFIHMMKGNIGTGLLALPEAIKNAGLIVGVIGMFVMGLIATHCMLLLVQISHELCKRLETQALNYAEIAQFAVAEHTDKPRYPKIAYFVINFFLIVTQFGFCCVYFVFISDHLNQVMCSAFNVDFDYRAWIPIILIPILLLSWIRNLDQLTSTSMVANLCILFSLGVIAYEVIYQLTVQDPHDSNEIAAIRRKGEVDYWAYKTLPLYFGGVVYAFEGIGVVLPLENKMKHPEHSTKVIVTAMLLITFLYSIFGGLGYITYGSKIQGSISLNLLSLRVGACSVFLIVKLYYAFAILATFPLQFYVPMDFLEPPLFKKLGLMYRFPIHHKKIEILVQIGFRTTLVVLTAALAVAIPDLDDLISLVGAFASSSLALIFPPLLEILVFWKDREHTFCCLGRWFWLTKDILIMALGIVGFLVGTYASVGNIVKNFGKNSGPVQYCGLGNCNYTLPN